MHNPYYQQQQPQRSHPPPQPYGNSGGANPPPRPGGPYQHRRTQSNTNANMNMNANVDTASSFFGMTPPRISNIAVSNSANNSVTSHHSANHNNYNNVSNNDYNAYQPSYQPTPTMMTHNATTSTTMINREPLFGMSHENMPRNPNPNHVHSSSPMHGGAYQHHQQQQQPQQQQQQYSNIPSTIQVQPTTQFTSVSSASELFATPSRGKQHDYNQSHDNNNNNYDNHLPPQPPQQLSQKEIIIETLPKNEIDKGHDNHNHDDDNDKDQVITVASASSFFDNDIAVPLSQPNKDNNQHALQQQQEQQQPLMQHQEQQQPLMQQQEQQQPLIQQPGIETTLVSPLSLSSSHVVSNVNNDNVTTADVSNDDTQPPPPQQKQQQEITTVPPTIQTSPTIPTSNVTPIPTSITTNKSTSNTTTTTAASTTGYTIPKFNKPRYASPRNTRRPLPNILLKTPTRTFTTNNNDTSKDNSGDTTATTTTVSTPMNNTSNIRKYKLSLPTPPSTFGSRTPRHPHPKDGNGSTNGVGRGNVSVGSGGSGSGSGSGGGINRFRMPPPITIGSTSPRGRGIISSSVVATATTTTATGASSPRSMKTSRLVHPSSPTPKSSSPTKSKADTVSPLKSALEDGDNNIDKQLQQQEQQQLNRDNENKTVDNRETILSSSGISQNLHSQINNNSSNNTKQSSPPKEPITEEVELPPLPEGWIDLTAPDSGRTYYLNIDTRETTWERPVVQLTMGTTTVVTIENESSVLENKPSANNEDGIHTNEPEMTPNDNMIEGVAELTQSSVIEAPRRTMSDDDYVHLSNSGEEQDYQENLHANNNTSNELLPLGWVELIDPSSGQPYYFNEQDGVTSWEKPQGEENADVTEVDNISQPENTRTQDFSPMKRSTPEATHVISEEDNSKIGGNDSNIVEANDDFTSKVESDQYKSDVDNLPPGWVEMMDPSSGKSYYYNEETMISSWDKPIINNDKNEDQAYDIDVAANVELKAGVVALEQTLDLDEAVVNKTVEDTQRQIENEEKDNVSMTTTQLSELPDGWIELFDSASGLPYYFNEAENTTSWDKPVMAPVKSEHASKEAGIDNPAMQVETEIPETQVQEADENDDDDVLDVDHQHHVEPDNKAPGSEAIPEEVKIEVESSLPSGWVELIDTSSGLPYYFNESEGVTTWEKPEGESTELNIESTNIEPSELTNETDNQAIDGATMQQPGEESSDYKALGKLNEHEESQKEMNSIHGSEEPSDLPTGWVKLIDSASGLPYYFNESENITSWDKPEFDCPAMQVESEIPETQGHEADENDDDDVLDVDHQHHVEPDNKAPGSEAIPEEVKIEVESSLPSGWVELIDTSSGLPYYFNESEGVTTWEKPIVDDIEPEMNGDIHLINSKSYDKPEDEPPNKEHAIIEDYVEVNDVGSDTNLDAPIGTELLPGWIEVVDEASGRKYYYNESEERTTWDKPIPPERESDVITDEDIPSTLSKEKVDEATVENENNEDPNPNSTQDEVGTSDLPTGWVELIDESTSQPYYLNELENITTWVKPVKTTKERTENNNVSKLVEDDSIVKASTKRKEEGRNVLPEGWTEVIDPASGKPYYFNEVENITTWIMPKANNNIGVNNQVTSSEIENKSNEFDKSSTELPQGWVELIDESSGKPYYFHEKDNVTTWERPNISSLESRPHPAHALASFGFGGKLCVMKPQVAESLSSVAGLQPFNQQRTMRKGPVEIHRLSSLVSSQDLPLSLDMSTSNEGITTGPLNSINDSEVFSYLTKKAGEERSDSELLWKLIYIAARWKGRLRSAEGISNPNGPEAAIVDLLLKNNNENTCESLSYFSENDVLAQQAASLEQIQSLLLRGKREEAVDCALAGNHYTLALLIGSVCDQSTYYAVAKAFVDKTLPLGTPLHTVTSLFANNQTQPSTINRDFWKHSAESLCNTWRSHLASILSNQTQGWKKVVISLGDELISQNKCHAAHFCYLVSGCPIASPQDRSSRLVLLGCDHTLNMNKELQTKDSLEGYERTEALEWAKRKGNPHAVITTLQPFKLKYALILADRGLLNASKAYVDNIRKCTGIINAQDFDTSSPRTPYSVEFAKELDILEDRLCVSMGIPNDNQNNKSRKSMNLPSVFTKLVGGSTSDLKESEASIPVPVNLVDDADQEDDLNMSFVSATSNILDVTAKSHPNVYRASNFVDTMTALPEEKSGIPDQPLKDDTTKENTHKHESSSPFFMNAAQSSVATGMSAPNIMDKAPSSAPAKPVEDAKVSQHAAPTAPKSSPLKEKDDDKSKEEAPNSGWSVGRWITKKLNPDANIADTGMAMEAYYDEKLKRWIFPGDDPDTMGSSALPPPPIMSAKNTDDGNQNITQTGSSNNDNDPLAALMAPSRGRVPITKTPSRGVGDGGGNALNDLMAPPRSSHFSEPRVKSGASRVASMNVPSSARRVGSSDAGSNMPPAPHFVIFKPTANTSAEQTNEETK